MAGLAALVAVGLAIGAGGCGTRLPASAFTGQATAGGGGLGQGGGGNGGGNGSALVDGVSATEIKVGMIDSISSPLGANAFSGPGYGAQAYFDALNAAGGVDGRKVVVDQCDDAGSGIGNLQCAHQLIDSDQVFAFAGNSIFDYAGASYVNSKDVPDIGGEPIDQAYDQYQHLYSIYGSDEPRDGTVGFDGTLYSSTEIYAYFKQKLGAHIAAVVEFNQPDSIRYGQMQVAGLRAEGYDVVTEQLDFALPNYAAAAADMKAHGVQIVFDAIDTTGNGALCTALDQAGVNLIAKVTTPQSWDQTVPSTYANAPKCRNVLYATSSERNYEDTQYPTVAAFRAAMAKYFPSRAANLSMWELDGWASAQWLTDAVKSCGADVTRGCVETYMNRSQPYDGHGLLIPSSFTVSRPGATTRACLNVARWQDSANGGHGGWVTQTPDMNANCFTVPVLASKA
ncbi:ABC transporter substrate-binding protein [Actinospica sp.]|uniref:ABC transporter substrate-binding protein n=1 Tax=Actinospica sp. TaxID=1872142 RepID=UPI002CE81901|nr:ABC transporter substrate-binding protein [Actinospica sp.]HWG22696.1 ABC transporter substrate-binding protein [Actinospica sp.]